VSEQRTVASTCLIGGCVCERLQNGLTASSLPFDIAGKSLRICVSFSSLRGKCVVGTQSLQVTLPAAGDTWYLSGTAKTVAWSASGVGNTFDIAIYNGVGASLVVSGRMSARGSVSCE
jgi:hypothetical protein